MDFCNSPHLYNARERGNEKAGGGVKIQRERGWERFIEKKGEEMERRRDYTIYINRQRSGKRHLLCTVYRIPGLQVYKVQCIQCTFIGIRKDNVANSDPNPS